MRGLGRKKGEKKTEMPGRKEGKKEKDISCCLWGKKNRGEGGARGVIFFKNLGTGGYRLNVEKKRLDKTNLFQGVLAPVPFSAWIRRKTFKGFHFNDGAKKKTNRQNKQGEGTNGNNSYASGRPKKPIRLLKRKDTRGK